MPHDSEKPEFLVERRRRRGIYEDPLQHLWAISYSDLLMVVMTFFVFFYSVSDKDKSSMLFQLIGDMQRNAVGTAKAGEDKAAGGARSGVQSGAQTGGVASGAAPNSRVLSSLDPIRDKVDAETKGMGISTEREGKVLLIHFPDEYYRLGQYKMGPSQEAIFARLLEVLAPFRSRLSAVLIGHADKVPVGHPIETIINSNLILSTLRAGRAAEFMMLKGWDPDRVFAKGTGEHARVARSLTLQLEDPHPPE